MSQRPPQQRRPPSQRTTLARKSTPTTLKTTPDHPAFQARSDTQTVQQSALKTRSHRTAPEVLTNAAVKHEAIDSVAASGSLTPPLRSSLSRGYRRRSARISATRFDAVRK